VAEEAANTPPPAYHVSPFIPGLLPFTALVLAHNSFSLFSEHIAVHLPPGTFTLAHHYFITFRTAPYLPAYLPEPARTDARTFWRTSRLSMATICLPDGTADGNVAATTSRATAYFSLAALNGADSRGETRRASLFARH